MASWFTFFLLLRPATTSHREALIYFSKIQKEYHWTHPKAADLVDRNIEVTPLGRSFVRPSHQEKRRHSL